MKKDAKPNKTVLLAILIILGVIFLILVILGSITDVSIDTSPTGEYSIKMYWVDVGGWGWTGKVYVVKHGFIDKKYWTGYYVPTTSRWTSDYTFELSDGSGKTGTHEFSVFDFVPSK